MENAIVAGTAGWLEQFLEDVIPSSSFGKPIPECSQTPRADATCYDKPAGYEHLAPVTWFGTLRLLVLALTVQAILMLLALGWDAAVSISLLGRKRRVDSRYTSLDIFVDCSDVGLSLASCITFVMRAQYGFSHPSLLPHRHSILLVVYMVDWIIAGAVVSFYAVNWHRAESKLQYVVSREPLLNVLTITSSSVIAFIQEGWIPFTFLRSLTIHTALHRLFKVLDLPVLQELLVLAVADFMALVFTFAGIIFMLENLGNPPGWENGPENQTNLSMMQSSWFVIVTVSTVGFGDISPVSFLGKVAGIVFIVVGVWFFSSSLGHISSLLESQAEGRGRYSLRWGVAKQRHVVLTGESLGSNELHDFAKELLSCEHEEHAKAGSDICCIAPSPLDIERYILSGELPSGRLQVLRGSLPDDLHRIAIHRASAIFFLGDVRHQNPQAHDCEQLMKAFMAHKHNAACEVYLTLLAPESLEAASQEIGSRKPAITLCTTTFKIGLLSRSAFCPGVISLIGNLVTSVSSDDLLTLRTRTRTVSEGAGRTHMTREYLHGLQQEIYKVNLPEQFRGQRFGELVLHTFTKYGVLLFALAKRKNDDDVESIAVHPGYMHEVEEEVAFAIACENPQTHIDNSIGAFFAQLPDFCDSSSSIQGADDAEGDRDGPACNASSTLDSPSNKESRHVCGRAMGWLQNPGRGSNPETLANWPEEVSHERLAQSVESMFQYRQRCRSPVASTSEHLLYLRDETSSLGQGSTTEAQEEAGEARAAHTSAHRDSMHGDFLAGRQPPATAAQPASSDSSAASGKLSVPSRRPGRVRPLPPRESSNSSTTARHATSDATRCHGAPAIYSSTPNQYPASNEALECRREEKAPKNAWAQAPASPILRYSEDGRGASPVVTRQSNLDETNDGNPETSDTNGDHEFGDLLKRSRRGASNECSDGDATVSFQPFSDKQRGSEVCAVCL